MDGFDLDTIAQVDEDVFNGSPNNFSDEEEDLPIPEMIGIDSAVQDDEQIRLKKSENQVNQKKTRMEIEHELELRILNKKSIRSQILEQSLKEGNRNKSDNPVPQVNMIAERKELNRAESGHVMNIVEKAGMGGIDKEKINEIIHEASKGSLFYKKQAQRQAEIHKSIEKMLNKVKMSTPQQVENARRQCDNLIEGLEKQRIFNRIIVHFDLDMFFAAVEIRDNPELADKPIAVGGDSMVSTSNYIARRFGVRAAMPGFIARKLCPQLLLIKPNGYKYRQASSEVFSILESYDPELTCMSLDEAYLDLTEYIKNTLEREGSEFQEYYDGTLPKIWWTRANEVVTEIRDAIYEKTKLTCSAGIACNTLLAKISTDINKPNGQFMVEGYPRDVNDFIRTTPVGKVSGIGKVSGQFLNALEIKTCGDLYEKRHFLPLVFYEINVKFYLRVALGDGETCIKSDEHRKSKSVERTFAAVKDTLMMLDKLDSICEELCTKYLKPYRIRGRTITVKLKRNTFTTTTKSYSLLLPTNDKLVVYSTARTLLLSEMADEPPEISYRLLGVKISNLAEYSVTNQMTIDTLIRNQQLGRTNTNESSVHQVDNSTSESSTDNSSQQALSPAPIDQDESEKNDLNVQSDSGESTQSSKADSLKRKLPPTKRIEDFFPTSQQKQCKYSNSNSVNHGSSQKLKDNEKVTSQDYKETHMDQETITGPNEVSQRELLQNQPNDEDFRCPYCFKPFSDFNILETHVDRCYLKTSIDVYKPFFTQQSKKTSPDFENEESINKSRSKSGETKSQSQLPKKSKANAKVKSVTTPTALKFKTASPKHLVTTPEGGTQKASFYQKFIESNSQNLITSPKFEPMQCPYCMHGFLNFNSLETHVIMCTKKK